MNREEKREELAQRAEAMGVPSLAAALRDGQNIAACDEISDFGWIRVSTMLPSTYEKVLVTDGNDVTEAWLREEEQDGGEQWASYGFNPFNLSKVIAWIYKPTPPFDDFYEV